MSTSSNISQSGYSPSDPETPQGRLQTFDQSLNHVDLGHSIEQSMKSAQNELHQKRIQALRKELDYLKSTEWEFEYDKEAEDLEQEDYLAEQLLDLELTNADSYEFDSEPEVPVAACFQKTGLITFVGENYVLIDGVLYYDLTNVSTNVYLNDKVLYLYYKNEDDTFKVVRIIENLGPAWQDEVDFNDEKKCEILEHVVIGEVDYRENRTVYLKDDDLKFDLDKVEATFVPTKGDWLQMKCSVQVDQDNPGQITTKKVINVMAIKALRVKTKSAKITQWDGSTGACDNNIYFNKQALAVGADPQVGFKVVLEAIESNQDQYTWRALKVLVDDSAQNDNIVKQQIKPEDKGEDSTLQLEQELKIEMTNPIKFENVHYNNTATKQLIIKNNSEQIYTVLRWKIMGKKSDSQITVKPFMIQPVRLHPGQSHTFQITCQPKFLGLTKEFIIVIFKGFQLKRYINIDVVNNDINVKHNMNGSNRKSHVDNVNDMKNIRKYNNRNIVPGVRPIKPPHFIPVRLAGFPIPDRMWSAVLGDSDQTVDTRDFAKILNRIEEKLPFLSSELNIGNYTDKWHTLLYMEEIQQNIQMRSYDMPKTFLSRHQEYLGLEISGLSERRPSLMKSDRVIVKDTWDNASPEYEGFIHDIRGNLVLIKFHPHFHEKYSGSDVGLEFHFNRTIYRRCHQAINLALTNLGPDLLFPSRIQIRYYQVPPEKLSNIKWLNVNLNDCQKTAVTNILLGECRPMPYCIYGPPGTGKTITVIETILQILTLLPDSRILVATPSNSAANLVAERLIQYRQSFTDSIIRLIAQYLLDTDTIPENIKPFCATLDIARENTAQSKYSVNRDGINLNCTTSFVGRHRVTIGTCNLLGTLAQMGLPKGHFTHVIVDEAGQAIEPEIMIPMTFTDKDNCQIILAGDPMQLGPVVLSKYCVEFGMDESYFSRILDRFPYQKDYEAFKEGFDKRLVTKLNDNYRSLEEVLELPSQLFYDGSLIPRINRNEDWIVNTTDIVSGIFGMNERRGGIFVYGIRGYNLRAEDSPSWFNPQEASMVALTVCKLFKKGLTPDDIGVITPYIAQVKHLRVVFDAMGLPQPKIGSVEEFQGQERRVILISTVRSTESYLEDDSKHTLGFVKHPKRLNVALTRAQVAVLLFCNPHLLSKDTLWNKVITDAVSKNLYSGCDLPIELSRFK